METPVNIEISEWDEWEVKEDQEKPKLCRLEDPDCEACQ